MTSGTGALLRGDALDLPARRSTVEQLSNRPFDLVYIDPPFNVGTAFTGRRGASGDAFADTWGGLDGFLSMLGPRLGALREAMSQHATLWLHLDQRAVHDAKVLADKVFGRAAFRGEIIWLPGNGSRSRGSIPVTHQTLLVYTRSASVKSDYVWNDDDPTLREPYADTSQKMHFKRTDEQGRRYRERVINGKAYRYYADAGRLRGSVWPDLPAMHANTPLMSESTGYPTQKPLALLDRIVRAASREGDLVVDPMCGSGTTLVAAARLGRDFVGNDRGELAITTSRDRLARESIVFLEHP